MMIVLHHELFAALDACDRLDDDWERDRCSGGVFMENRLTATNPGHTSRYLRAEEPLYPCSGVAEQFRTVCYGDQAAYILGTQREDYGRAFAICAQAGPGNREICAEGLGQLAAGDGRRGWEDETAIVAATGARRACQRRVRHRHHVDRRRARRPLR